MKHDMELVLEKLREAESIVLACLNNSANRAAWDSLEFCKVTIWRAMGHADDAARAEAR